MSSQNVPIIFSKTSKRNLRRKKQRVIKKVKFENQDDSIIDADTDSTSNTIVDQTDKRRDIFYDPLRHKTQLETRQSTKDEAREYICTQWVSEDFLSSDLKSVKISQPYTLIDPKFTFIKKFLEKRQQRLITLRLLQTDLLLENIINQNTYIAKSLSPQTIQSLPIDNFEIPLQYMVLLESEIFNKGPSNSTPEQWKEFGLWAHFSKVPNFNKRFRLHCRHLWSNVRHAHKEAQKKIQREYNIPETFRQILNNKQNIAVKTTEVVTSGGNFEGYYHVFNPQCFKNSFDEVVIDFFDINNLTIIEYTRDIVNEYYIHNLDNKSHQSKEFKKELAEHFGAFTNNNNEPYTTANTVSNHCPEHRQCVQKLIGGLQPLSNIINHYFCNIYPSLYAKMKKLDLGPNVPKSFGGFPTIAINYNVISQFHRDIKDHRNTLCVVCPLGLFEGGQLVFPELKLMIYAKQGHAIAFRSNILVHGNLPVISGIRHSVVFFIHVTSIKQNRKFSTLFNDSDSDIDTDISMNVKNKKTRVSKNHAMQDKKLSKSLKLDSQSSKMNNSRRSCLDLEPARRGLPAKYKNN